MSAHEENEKRKHVTRAKTVYPVDYQPPKDIEGEDDFRKPTSPMVQKYQVHADKVDYASQHYMHSKLDFQAEDAKAVAYAQHHYTHPSYQ